MADFYEQWAAETLSYANDQVDEEWRDVYEEVASELLSLANQAHG